MPRGPTCRPRPRLLSCRRASAQTGKRRTGSEISQPRPMAASGQLHTRGHRRCPQPAPHAWQVPAPHRSPWCQEHWSETAPGVSHSSTLRTPGTSPVPTKGPLRAPAQGCLPGPPSHWGETRHPPKPSSARVPERGRKAGGVSVQKEWRAAAAGLHPEKPGPTERRLRARGPGASAQLREQPGGQGR